MIGNKRLYETLANLVQRGEVDELAPIKKIAKMKHGINLILLQVRQEHLVRKLEEMVQEDRGIRPCAKVRIRDDCDFHCVECITRP